VADRHSYIAMFSKLKFSLAQPLILSIASLVFLLSITAPAFAESGGGEGGGNQQNPAQVIIQIAIAAIILKILSLFRLP
jgi:hypothetical protein